MGISFWIILGGILVYEHDEKKQEIYEIFST